MPLAGEWKRELEQKVKYLILLSISFLHSITKNVEWEPRLDSFVFFNDIKLTQ